MSLDEHTAAAISEIDRTLRSLGLRDDFSAPPPLALTASPCAYEAVREPTSRRNAAAQATGPSPVSAGVQTCVYSVQRGVQHCPRVQSAATQTEPREEVPPCLLSLFHVAATTSKIVDDHMENLGVAFSTVSVLAERVRVLEKKTRCIAAQLTASRCEVAVLALAKDEQLARSCVVANEQSARLELVALRVDELTRRATAAERVRPRGCSERPRNTPAIKLRDKDPTGDRDTPNSSLNDLTDLLDECWRVLEE